MSDKKDNYISASIETNQLYFDKMLKIEKNFDIVCRQIHIGGRKALMYYVNGFCKEDDVQKIMEYFMDITKEDMPKNAAEMLQDNLPYVDVSLCKEKQKLITGILSGLLVLFIDGFSEGIMLDARSYPARSIDEPDKDKTLRGSKDGFVETLIVNTAMIRRRIRDNDLTVEIYQVGEASKTDVSFVYMEKRVNKKLLERLKTKINEMKTDALTMGHQSLAECLYGKNWFNPFPKFRYTQRPDTATAQILEGNIVILVDNSPQAMILPTSLFDILEEADDYYFPPITGTYLRCVKSFIGIVSFFITPLYLLITMHPEWMPQTFSFVLLKETANIPVIWQFLILEIALDGLRLAAVNTSNLLSTPLSIMAALIVGDFSVSSGWFNSEVMLYMAFVAIANYTQTNYELSYAIKFMRILTLILTQFFGVWGLLIGTLICIVEMATNQTVGGNAYLYPLIPLHPKKLWKRLIRNNKIHLS